MDHLHDTKLRGIVGQRFERTAPRLLQESLWKSITLQLHTLPMFQTMMYCNSNHNVEQHWYGVLLSLGRRGFKEGSVTDPHMKMYSPHTRSVLTPTHTLFSVLFQPYLTTMTMEYILTSSSLLLALSIDILHILTTPPYLLTIIL